MYFGDFLRLPGYLNTSTLTRHCPEQLQVLRAIPSRATKVAQASQHVYHAKMASRSPFDDYNILTITKKKYNQLHLITDII